ncbi:Bromodomain containing protein [Parasponia andersonii]|uniref:Bromodomain containing protein n=1 Tax=Parasponia andersonii TaxID=3476 RepID=A0A2P5A7Q1_PARAD|nr:Bromodomain containing protein [Parasponia andersonii]
MASAVLANRNETNWPQPVVGAGAKFMGKVPKPNKSKRQFQFHAPAGDLNGCQIDESSAVTQTASDDASSINHRRSSEFNLGHSQYVSFNTGSYSRKELGKLKNRLLTELDRIRQLQNRIDAGELNPQPKKLGPGKKASGTKRPFPTNLNHAVKDSTSNFKRSHWENTNLMKNCSSILTKLMKHKHPWIFNKPVDVVGMGLHDYHDIIKRPMDLGTVKSNLSKNLYASPVDFASDVRLTFQNAMTYNPPGHDIHAMAGQLLVRFEELYRPLNEQVGDMPGAERPYDEELQASSWDHVEPERPKREDLMRAETKPEPERAPASSSNPTPPPPPAPLVQSPVRTPSPMRAPPVKPLKQPKPKAKDPNKREMSMEEKHRLGIGLQSLPQEKMEQVVQIIKKRNGHLRQDGDEIELDIEAVDTETLWELDRLVTNWKKMVSKIKRQALMNNNNSNSNINNVATNKGDVELTASERMDTGPAEPKRPKKGEARDEDVDIGDDMPMNSFPPVEIEKDVGDHHGGGSSSSSSSSGSSSSDSSSCSDSDSGSSSGSDSDDDNAHS